LAEAAIEHEERLKQQAEAYRQEQETLRQQRDERIRALNEQLRDELARNREAFIARIRDLDAALLGEQKLRQAYYSAMLRDAQNFFASYRSALNGGSTVSSGITGSTGKVSVTGNSQFGGYVPEGPRYLHANEFVATQGTTRILEQAVGGKLTQQNLQGLAAGGTTINVEFPAGLVTQKELGNILDKNNADLFKLINRAVGAR